MRGEGNRGNKSERRLREQMRMMEIGGVGKD
jgi:hypothetical protein